MSSARSARAVVGTLSLVVGCLAGTCLVSGQDDLARESKERGSGRDSSNLATENPAKAAAPADVSASPPEGWLLGASPRDAAARKVTLEKVEQVVSFRVEDVPLREAVVKLLGDLAVKVKFDQPTIDANGSASLDDPVSIDAEEEPAESILSEMLEQRGLAWSPRGNAIVITTKEVLDTRREAIAYDVADLVVDAEGAADMSLLIQLLTQIVAPDSWQEVGGSGTLTPIVRERSALLLVDQPFPIQQQIAKTLASLRLTGIAKTPPASLTTFTLVPPPHRSVVSASFGYAESKPQSTSDASVGTESGQQPAKSSESAPFIRPVEGLPLDISPEEAKRRSEVVAAIQQPASIDCRDLPLSKVIEEVTAGLPIRLKFDRKAIDDDGTVSLEDPVTHATENEPVEAILYDLLQPRGLTWLPRGDSLVITTWTEADALLEAVAYDVTDLVVNAQTGQADMQMLVELIFTVVAPDSWLTVGGAGTVNPFAREQAALLLVRQTSKIQAEVSQLLARLRETGVVTGRSPSTPPITLVPLQAKPPMIGPVTGAMCPSPKSYMFGSKPDGGTGGTKGESAGPSEK